MSEIEQEQNEQSIDMVFLRDQFQVEAGIDYVVKFEVNRFTGTGICHMSKAIYEALPKDFAGRMTKEVTQILDQVIGKAVSEALMNIYVEELKKEPPEGGVE